MTNNAVFQPDRWFSNERSHSTRREEFAVIMPETSLENALRLAERFRKSCEEHLIPGQDKPLKVTVSAGVATVGPSDNISVADLIKRADSLLYKSKKDGRNRVSG